MSVGTPDLFLGKLLKARHPCGFSQQVTAQHFFPIEFLDPYPFTMHRTGRCPGINARHYIANIELGEVNPFF